MNQPKPGPRRIFDDTAGWVEVPALLSQAESLDVLEACDALLQLPASERRGRDKAAAGTHHLDELDDRIELVEAIAIRRTLTDVVAEILGLEFRRDVVGYRSPQPSFGGQKLHTDDVPKLDDGPAVVATAIIALTEFTATNGATRVVPGSHRRTDLQRLAGSVDNHDDEIMLTGSVGTAFVFSGHLLHSGTTNQSSNQRPALQLTWRATSAVRS